MVGEATVIPMSAQQFPLTEASVTTVAEVIRGAGRRSLRWYRVTSHSQADNKRAVEAGGDGGFDPVTEADRAVESEIRSWLARHYPSHHIFGEEFGRHDGDGADSDYEWLIDPIDGTRAFVTGQPMWGTLVGLRRGGLPVAGWMYLPVLDESYVGVWDGMDERWAWFIDYGPGEGEATTTALAVSATTSVAEAVVLSTHPEMFAPGPEADAFAAVADRAKMVRYSGDCVNYGLLAMGLVDLVIENELASYDIVPLIPIITAAGGVVTDRHGGSATEGGFVVAASTPELHTATLELLNGG